MAFVNKWANHDAHGKEKEELKAPDPGNCSRRFGREENGLIIGLEDTVRLGAMSVDMAIMFVWTLA